MNTIRYNLLLLLLVGISGTAYGDLSTDVSGAALVPGAAHVPGAALVSGAALQSGRPATEQASTSPILNADSHHPISARSSGAPAVSLMSVGLDGGLDLEGALNLDGTLNHDRRLNLDRGAWPEPVETTAGEGNRQVFELPPPPSSSSLFLSAALSAGAWHLLRRAKDLNHAHLPDWYHPNAPHQIGHAVVFDPTLSFELLPVCVFDTPIGGEHFVISRARPEPEARCESSHILPVTAPRGPPAVS